MEPLQLIGGFQVVIANEKPNAAPGGNVVLRPSGATVAAARSGGSPSLLPSDVPWQIDVRGHKHSSNKMCSNAQSARTQLHNAAKQVGARVRM